MRQFTLGLALAATLAAPAMAASPRHVVKQTIVKTIVSPDGTTRTVSGSAAAKALVASCGERHFETSAEVGVGDSKRVSRIKLCAKPGEDAAAWLATLRQARSRISNLTQLPPASRTKLAADFDAEIARVSASTSSATAVPAVPAPTPIDPALIAGPPK